MRVVLRPLRVVYFNTPTPAHVWCYLIIIGMHHVPGMWHFNKVKFSDFEEFVLYDNREDATTWLQGHNKILHRTSIIV